MSVIIRLRRAGRNRIPFYRIVVSDSRNAVKGQYLESVGWYDPKVKGVNFQLDLERIRHWESHGAHLSDTVRSLVKRAHLMPPKPDAEAAQVTEQGAAPAGDEPADQEEVEPVAAEPASEGTAPEGDEQATDS